MKTVTVYLHDDTPHRYEGKSLSHAFTDGFLEVTGEDWAQLIPVVRIRKIEVAITEE